MATDLSDAELLAAVRAEIDAFEQRMAELAASMQWAMDHATAWHYTGAGPYILDPAVPEPVVRASSTFNKGINDEDDGRWLAVNLGKSAGGDATRHFLSASKAQFFILCLSLDKDNAYHWDEYANHGQGMALGFRVDLLHAAAKTIGDPLFLEVRYSSPHDPGFTDIAGSFSRMHQNVFAGTGSIGGTQRGYWRGTSDIVAEHEWLFKTDRFTRDAERRIAYKRPPNVKTAIVGTETKSFVEIPYASALVEIMLGPDCPPLNPAFETALKLRFPTVRITRSVRAAKGQVGAHRPDQRNQCSRVAKTSRCEPR